MMYYNLCIIMIFNIFITSEVFEMLKRYAIVTVTEPRQSDKTMHGENTMQKSFNHPNYILPIWDWPVI